MEKNIKKLAKFMGMEVSPTTNIDVTYFFEGNPFELYTFNPYENWRDTMLVEGRLREKELWGDYVIELVHQVLHLNCSMGIEYDVIEDTMAATQAQRMEAVCGIMY